jgi:8-oxo-dGTP diphosphatase
MVMNEDDDFLLVKSRRGWEFPGGYLEDEEAIKDAAIREVKEESGIDIELMNSLGVEQDIERSTCVFLFKGRPISGELRGSNETEDAGYFSLKEVMNMMTIAHFRERVIRCLNEDEKFSIITR